MKELTLLEVAKNTINKVNRCKHDGKYNHDVMAYVNEMMWLIEQLSERVTDLETVRDNMLEDAESRMPKVGSLEWAAERIMAGEVVMHPCEPVPIYLAMNGRVAYGWMDDASGRRYNVGLDTIDGFKNTESIATFGWEIYND